MSELGLLFMQKCKYQVHDKVYYIKYDGSYPIENPESIIYVGYITSIMMQCGRPDIQCKYAISEEDEPCTKVIIIDNEDYIDKYHRNIYNKAEELRIKSNLKFNNKGENKNNEECN